MLPALKQLSMAVECCKTATDIIDIMGKKKTWKQIYSENFRKKTSVRKAKKRAKKAVRGYNAVISMMAFSRMVMSSARLFSIATSGTLPKGINSGDYVMIDPNTRDGIVIPKDIRLSLDSNTLIPITIKTEG